MQRLRQLLGDLREIWREHSQQGAPTWITACSMDSEQHTHTCTHTSRARTVTYK